VAQLPGIVTRTPVQPAIDDDAGANPGAYRDVDDVGQSPGNAEALLRQGRDIGVVIEVTTDAKTLRD
jgi:hypothetical protein